MAPSDSTVPTVAYLDGVGCFLTGVRSTKVASLSSTKAASSRIGSSQVTISAEQCQVVSVEVMLRGQSSTGIIGDVIARRLGVDRMAVTETADLYLDLGASYDDVRVIANELGNMFSVGVSEEAIKPMNTVGDILNCVDSAMMD